LLYQFVSFHVVCQESMTKACKCDLWNFRYNDLMPHDMQREAFKGLLKKTNLPKDSIDYVVVGTVIQVCCL